MGYIRRTVVIPSRSVDSKKCVSNHEVSGIPDAGCSLCSGLNDFLLV